MAAPTSSVCVLADKPVVREFDLVVGQDDDHSTLLSVSADVGEVVRHKGTYH